MHRRLEIEDLGQVAQANPATYLYAARALRDFGDGFVAVLLPAYLTAMGLGAFEIGLVSTLALFGSASMTLAIGLLGARIDQRRLLIAASGLMIATGLAFALSSTYAVVLLVALVGTINPSSGSVSIFVPLEHALLSRSVADAGRTRMFARYSLIGALAAAVGALAAASPDVLATMGVSRLAALKAMFVAYAMLGVAGGFMYALLPAETPTAEAKPVAALGPSRGIVYKLAALFSIDAFGGGFAVQSLIALWLFSKFGLSLAAAGLFFFWSGVLAAFSFPVADLALAPHRPRQHDGLHAYPIEPVPDAGCHRSQPGGGAGAAAGARGAVADGRADALLLRDGRGHAAGTGGCGQRHIGAAQPCRRCQSGNRGGPVRSGLPGVAADDLRRSQDPLRLCPALGLPSHQAAGRAVSAINARCGSARPSARQSSGAARRRRR